MPTVRWELQAMMRPAPATPAFFFLGCCLMGGGNATPTSGTAPPWMTRRLRELRSLRRGHARPTALSPWSRSFPVKVELDHVGGDRLADTRRMKRGRT